MIGRRMFLGALAGAPVFKQSVADEEQAAVDAFLKRLDEDEAFASKVLKAFGFG